MKDEGVEGGEDGHEWADIGSKRRCTTSICAAAAAAAAV